MRYLLDTNVVSELRKARTPKIDPEVACWTDTVDAGDMFISAITVMEIEKGILNLARKDPRQEKILRGWFTRLVMPEFKDRILPFDTAAAVYCAGLHIPDRRPANDAMIAAIAYCHNMTLVTRNVKDFAGLGVTLLNPWCWQK